VANDLTLPIRRATLAALKADAALTALVPPASIYPQTVSAMPAWPFVRMGAPSGLPIRATCVDGNQGNFAVHGFAKPRDIDGTIVETAEDHAARLGAAIASALDRKVLVLDGGQRARLTWTGSQLLLDGAEADAFHTVQSFGVRVLA
jgi:Protein of unknown function (DUF3168)